MTKKTKRKKVTFGSLFMEGVEVQAQLLVTTVSVTLGVESPAVTSSAVCGTLGLTQQTLSPTVTWQAS